MAWELRAVRRQKVRYDDANSDNKLTYQLVVNGVKVTPTSATITVYSPAGTELLAATAMTVSGSLVTYALSTTTEADYPVATGYRALVSVTYSSTAYKQNVYFDVVKNILRIMVGRDQLINEDKRIMSMEWDNDVDFAAPLTAARDEIQLDVETQVVDGKKLNESMLLDESRFSMPMVYLTLAKIYNSAGDNEARDYYENKYQEKVKQVLSSFNFDTGQDLSEDDQIGGLQAIRLVP